MRKNKMMRAASVLLVAVMLTTCVISGTFAKYTTSATGNDTARVARWGFGTTQVQFDNLFSSTYKYVNTSGNSVSSSNNDSVIAPGTSGSARFQFKLADNSKKPEVAYNFTVSTSGSSIDETIKSNNNIKWALTTSDTAPTSGDNEWGNWDALIAEIQNLAGTSATQETNCKTAKYEAGNTPDMVNNTYCVHWMWDFGDDSSVSGDNAMGNATTLAEVTLKITITATQID